MLLVNRFMNIVVVVVLGQHDLVLQGVVLALFVIHWDLFILVSNILA